MAALWSQNEWEPGGTPRVKHASPQGDGVATGKDLLQDLGAPVILVEACNPGRSRSARARGKATHIPKSGGARCSLILPKAGGRRTHRHIASRQEIFGMGRNMKKREMGKSQSGIDNLRLQGPKKVPYPL